MPKPKIMHLKQMSDIFRTLALICAIGFATHTHATTHETDRALVVSAIEKAAAFYKNNNKIRLLPPLSRQSK